MGCCLLGLLFAADYLLPKEAAPAQAEAATVSNGGSLASWRHSQEKNDKPQWRQWFTRISRRCPRPPNACNGNAR